MKKEISRIKINYLYDKERSLNKYCYNNAWYNGGGFAELIRKAQLGLKPTFDRYTPFDVGCDVDNIMESVKSNRAAFTDEELGHDYDTIWNNYFQQDKAQRYSYITWDNENVIAYVMNIEEFKEFAKAFTFFEKGTGKRHDRIRFKKESKKMLKWLNARAE